MIKAFISYSHQDKEFVQRLASDLEIRVPELRIWYDTLIAVGDAWAETLSKEIESADIVISVLSPAYFMSVWTQKEAQIAMLRRTEGKTRLLPIVVRPCQPSGFLSTLTWVDFTENYDQGLENLIWGITGKKPRAAKGTEPGELTEKINPEDLKNLYVELKEAVHLFKLGSETSKIEAKGYPKSTEENNKCFVVMPFEDANLQIVYEDFVKPVIEKCNLHCERGDDVFGSNIIMEDILKSIQTSKIIIADLTGKNANVFYEVGICHTLNKTVLLLAQSIEDVPFDLRHRRVLLYEYSPRGCKRLESALYDNLKAIV